MKVGLSDTSNVTELVGDPNGGLDVERLMIPVRREEEDVTGLLQFIERGCARSNRIAAATQQWLRYYYLA